MLCENNISIVRQYDSATDRQIDSKTADRQHDSMMATTSHHMHGFKYGGQTGQER